MSEEKSLDRVNDDTNNHQTYVTSSVYVAPTNTMNDNLERTEFNIIIQPSGLNIDQTNNKTELSTITVAFSADQSSACVNGSPAVIGSHSSRDFQPINNELVGNDVAPIMTSQSQEVSIDNKINSDICSVTPAKSRHSDNIEVDGSGMINIAVPFDDESNNIAANKLDYKIQHNPETRISDQIPPDAPVFSDELDGALFRSLESSARRVSAEHSVSEEPVNCVQYRNSVANVVQTMTQNDIAKIIIKSSVNRKPSQRKAADEFIDRQIGEPEGACRLAELKPVGQLREIQPPGGRVIDQMASPQRRTLSIRGGRSVGVAPGGPVFSRKLKSATVVEGEEAEFVCSVTVGEEGSVEWLKDGQQIETQQGHIQITRIDDISRIFISGAQLGDAGRYVCRAVNSLGEARTMGSLLVLARPPGGSVVSGSLASNLLPFNGSSSSQEKSFLQAKDGSLREKSVTGKMWRKPEVEFLSRDYSVVCGGGVTLECRVGGHPTPSVTWFKDKNVLKSTDSHQIESDDTVSRLVIGQVLSRDSGLYTCSVENQLGSARAVCTLNVLDSNKKTTENLPFESAVTKETKDLKDEISNLGSSVTVINSEVQDIKEVNDVKSPEAYSTVIDETCSDLRDELNDNPVISSNSVDVDKLNLNNNEIEVPLPDNNNQNVDESPKVEITEDKAAEALADDNETISNAIDPNNITKEKDDLTGNDLTSGSDNENGGGGLAAPGVASLLMEREKMKLHRVHTMPARLPLKKPQTSTEENSTPTTENTESKQDTLNQDDTQLSCEPDEVLDDDDDVYDDDDDDFAPVIDDLSPEVMSVVRGDTVELVGRISGSPTPTVFWMKGHTPISPNDKTEIRQDGDTVVLKLTGVEPVDTGCYMLFISNEYGTDHLSSSVTVEDRPDPPVGQPAVTSVTDRSVVLSWYGSSFDGGSPILRFMIELCICDTKPGQQQQQEWILVNDNCKHTTQKVENLKPDTAYQFRVRTGNKYGFSEPGQPSEQIITTNRVLSRSDCSTEYLTDVSDDIDPISPVMLDGPLSPVSILAAKDELPFQPREVHLDKEKKFQDYYTLGEEIGRGKFGSVCLCKEKASGMEFAAKFIRVKAGQREEFRKEVEVMNELRHPKILMLWDAFESTREIIIVMEHIGGKELLERVINDDYVLTERECVHFMRQICEGVRYIHAANILHLDLKPENILCVTINSNEIKIIDFGLARRFDPSKSFKVMFGTPEFVAPEVVNYDNITYTTDMWSVGVICYILLSGLSPFLGDNDSETLANVTKAQYDFDDEAFDEISDDAKEFIQLLLQKQPEKRMTADHCLKHRWLSQDVSYMRAKRLSTAKHKRFMARRKWQKTGNALRALGRMAALQKQPASPSETSPQGSNGNLGKDKLDAPRTDRSSLLGESTSPGATVTPLSPGIRHVRTKSVGSKSKDSVTVSGSNENKSHHSKTTSIINSKNRPASAGKSKFNRTSLDIANKTPLQTSPNAKTSNRNSLGASEQAGLKSGTPDSRGGVVRSVRQRAQSENVSLIRMKATAISLDAKNVDKSKRPSDTDDKIITVSDLQDSLEVEKEKSKEIVAETIDTSAPVNTDKISADKTEAMAAEVVDEVTTADSTVSEDSNNKDKEATQVTVSSSENTTSATNESKQTLPAKDVNSVKTTKSDIKVPVKPKPLSASKPTFTPKTTSITKSSTTVSKTSVSSGVSATAKTTPLSLQQKVNSPSAAKSGGAEGVGAGRGTPTSKVGGVSLARNRLESQIRSGVEKPKKAPMFVRKLKNLQVTERSSAKFEVVIDGHPRPVVTWFKDGQQIPDSGQSEDQKTESGEVESEPSKVNGDKYSTGWSDDKKAWLVINQCGEDDDAEYGCTATNQMGRVTCKAELYVEPYGEQLHN